MLSCAERFMYAVYFSIIILFASLCRVKSVAYVGTMMAMELMILQRGANLWWVMC